MSELLVEPLDVFLIEGPSKTMKTSVSEAAAAALAREGLIVVRDDAGSFFRKVAVASWGLLRARGIDNPTQQDFDNASLDALEMGIPYDTQRPWLDLHTPHTDDIVAITSTGKHVQDAGKEWWSATADRAVEAGADALVLDGRNPRDRMLPWLTKYSVGVTAELYCICDPTIAAERTLNGNGIPDPSVLQIRDMRRSIIGRRLKDRNRGELPYIAPTSYVRYTPDLSPEQVVLRALARGEPDMPLPIRINTGELDYATQNASVDALVLAAHDLVQ